MTPIPVTRSDASPTPKPIPKLIALPVSSLLPPVGAAVDDEVKVLAAEEVDELEITGSEGFYN
jgi:hypothetical protein